MLCFLDPGTSPSKKGRLVRTCLGYLEVYCTILFDVFVGLAIGTAVSPSTLFKVK